MLGSKLIEGLLFTVFLLPTLFLLPALSLLLFLLAIISFLSPAKGFVIELTVNVNLLVTLDSIPRLLNNSLKFTVLPLPTLFIVPATISLLLLLPAELLLLFAVACEEI